MEAQRMTDLLNVSLNYSHSSPEPAEEASDTQLFVIKFFCIYGSVLGCIGNVLTITAILKGKLHHQSPFLKILNLSVINLIHCVIFLPLIAVQAFTGLWTDHPLLCNLFSYGLFSNMGTEVIGCVCITLNRYFCVVYHKVYERVYNSRFKLAVQMVVTWFTYPILLCLPLFGVWSRYEYDARKLVCHPFRGQSCTGYCLLVFIPSIATFPIIGYCYSHIICVYMKVQRNLGLSSRESSQNSNSSLYHSKEHHRTHAELRMALTILAVVLVYGLCRTPFMVLYMYDPAMVKVDPLIHTIVIYMGTNASWINPLIYAYTNRQIRKSLKNAWPSCKT